MTRGTDRLDRMINGTHERSSCGATLCLPLVMRYEPGYVQCMHPVDPRFLNASGALFGGYMSALLDDVTGPAAMTIIGDDKACATAELNVSYLRPCLPQDSPINLEARVINENRRSYHIEATAKRADGKLLAKAQAVYAVSDRR